MENNILVPLNASTPKNTLHTSFKNAARHLAAVVNTIDAPLDRVISNIVCYLPGIDVYDLMSASSHQIVLENYRNIDTRILQPLMNNPRMPEAFRHAAQFASEKIIPRLQKKLDPFFAFDGPGY